MLGVKRILDQIAYDTRRHVSVPLYFVFNTLINNHLCIFYVLEIGGQMNFLDLLCFRLRQRQKAKSSQCLSVTIHSLAVLIIDGLHLKLMLLLSFILLALLPTSIQSLLYDSYSNTLNHISFQSSFTVYFHRDRCKCSLFLDKNI